jgi:hypothetical protein
MSVRTARCLGLIDLGRRRRPKVCLDAAMYTHKSTPGRRPRRRVSDVTPEKGKEKGLSRHPQRPHHLTSPSEWGWGCRFRRVKFVWRSHRFSAFNDWRGTGLRWMGFASRQTRKREFSSGDRKISSWRNEESTTGTVRRVFCYVCLGIQMYL